MGPLLAQLLQPQRLFCIGNSTIICPYVATFYTHQTPWLTFELDTSLITKFLLDSINTSPPFRANSVIFMSPLIVHVFESDLESIQRMGQAISTHAYSRRNDSHCNKNLNKFCLYQTTNPFIRNSKKDSVSYLHIFAAWCHDWCLAPSDKPSHHAHFWT